MNIGQNSFEVAQTLENLSSVYINMEDFTKALEFSKKALEIKKLLTGTASIYVASTLKNIAVIYEKLNEEDKAL